jgi:AraC-like DNA-binding protein
LNFIFEGRPADSPFVETIWRSQSENAGTFLSSAASQWEMVVTRHNGTLTLTVRGPETKATPAYCPENAEFFGIVFRPGTFMPHLPPGEVMDRKDAHLPNATSMSFWLHGSTWQFPTYENAETFIARLVRDGLLVRDPVVDAVLQNQLKDLSIRSVQRRFLQATGLTQCTFRQIERAREAVTLLEQGVLALDIVELAGYADQAHLTRSLKRFIGQTPTQIIAKTSLTESSLG